MDNKYNFSNQDSKRCVDHPNSPIFEKEGENYCGEPNCGISLGNYYPSDIACEEEKQLGSMIPKAKDKDSNKKSIGSGEIYRWANSISKDKNLHKFHKEYSDHNIVKSKHVISELEKICEKLKISSNIKLEAKKNYKILNKYNLHHRQNNVCIAVECIFLAQKKYDPNKSSMIKLAEKSGEEFRKLVKYHNKTTKVIWKNEVTIDNKLDNRVEQIYFTILKFPDDIISQKLKKEIKNNLNDKKFESILSGISTTSIAAGVIYIICIKNGLVMNPKKIAKFYEINENTLRNQAKKIAKLWNIELRDKRKKL